MIKRLIICIAYGIFHENASYSIRIHTINIIKEKSKVLDTSNVEFFFCFFLIFNNQMQYIPFIPVIFPYIKCNIA